jgi:hypothetical protein
MTTRGWIILLLLGSFGCVPWFIEGDLLRALNRQLGTSFRSMKDMRAHLKDRRPDAKIDNPDK